MEHVLLLCDWTRAVWFGSQMQCTPSKESVSSVGVWLQKMFRKCNQGNKTKASQTWSRIGITMWSIWKARNRKVSQSTEPNPETTINYAKMLELDYFNATEKEDKSTTEPNRRKNVPLKLNTDVAFSKETRTEIVAVVIRDCNGNLRGGTTANIKTSSSIIAEATTIREAIIIAENLNIENVNIESDCLQLIQALKTGDTLWEAESIIRDIKIIQKRLPNCGFSWISRQGNVLAHTLASLKAHNQLANHWSSCPPKQIVELTRNEKMGLPSLLQSCRI
ncbi:hypothetical protein Ahy_A07g031709 [Arachis hypogaea]|uniref:RNase H type-1 domain-containing protein n=1 Tax=Arachis hypogaea TaxID=3818 RepID=A0A445C4W4_ARAHY|nr:hypothetical protein Ahy_A07g031709 [Arachis hypogaea]